MPRPIDFAALRRLIRPAQVLDLAGIPHHREPCGSHRGPCPLCQSVYGRHRSFESRDEWWICHRCRRHGDAVQLYQWLRTLPVYPAAVELCGRLGVTVPYLPPRG